MDRGVTQSGAARLVAAVEIGTRLALAGGLAARLGLVKQGLALLRLAHGGGAGQHAAPQRHLAGGGGVVVRLGAPADAAVAIPSGVQGAVQFAQRGRAALAVHRGLGALRAMAGGLDGGMRGVAAEQKGEERGGLGEPRGVTVPVGQHSGAPIVAPGQGPVGLTSAARDGRGGRLAVTVVSASDAATLRSAARAPAGVGRSATAPGRVRLASVTAPHGRQAAEFGGLRGVVAVSDLTAMGGMAIQRAASVGGFSGPAGAPSRRNGLGFGDSVTRGAHAPAAALLGRGGTGVAAGGPGAAGGAGAAVGASAAAIDGVQAGGAGTSAVADGEQASAPAGGHNGAYVQGDVYFDGALMGRWMSRALAREAARPPAGGAAFDARRNPLPTGRMIGG